MTAKRRIAHRFAAAPLLLLATAAFAEVPAPPGAEWSDRHMRSNFANRDVATPRPAIQGLDADGHIAPGPAPSTQVQEQTLKINPLGWQPGPGNRHTTGTGRPFAKGTPFTSPDSSLPQRSNALHTQASRTPTGGRQTP